MKSYIQFLTTPTSDTPGTALYLHFDDKRYIVGNVHEGLQRAGLQVGARFFKAKDFFLTGRTEWQKNGGLIGMILTLADAANSSAAARAEALKLKVERAKKRQEEELHRRKPSKKASLDSIQREDAQMSEEDPTVTLHGGPNLTHVLATARSFVFRKGTPIKIIEHQDEGHSSTGNLDWEPTWADTRIQVWAMAITPSFNDGSHRDHRPVSPRKRSLGEFMTGERPSPVEIANQWSVQPSTSENQVEQDQKIREFCVSEMFGSKWRYDNLVETPLHEVKLPAAIFFRDAQTHKIEKYAGPIPDGTTPVPNVKVLVRQPWPGALIEHLPPTKHSTTAMSYIIRNHRQRGKFKPAAAKALDVPTVPFWSKLAAGEDVQLENGTTITPDMVLEAGKEGAGFAIVELPSKDYVQDLIDRPEWSAEKPMVGLEAIVWLLGAGVAQDRRLITFMKERSKLKHIVSSPDQCPNYLSMTSAASAAIRHHGVDPARYPIPVHSNAVSLVSESLLDQPENESIVWLPAKRGLKLQLEPTFAIEEGEIIPHLDTALVEHQTPQEVIKLGQAAQSEVSRMSAEENGANHDLPGQDAEIVCLGTGSALPSQYRNVSATLLRVPGSGSYLLDCGENTLGQLKRVYSETEYAEVLRDLKMIWISHLHADHHLGTASVVKAWYEEVHGKDVTKRPRPSLTEQLLSPGKFLEEGKRLFVVGHHNMLRWLEEYSSVEDFGYNQLIPLEPFPAARSKPDLGPLEWNGMQVGFNTSRDSWV
ncbi:ribonuclease Z, partial [Lecanoromycetidae sp. Uapishka_2]